MFVDGIKRPDPRDVRPPGRQIEMKISFGFLALVLFGLLGVLISTAPLILIGIPAVLGASYFTGEILFRMFREYTKDRL